MAATPSRPQRDDRLGSPTQPFSPLPTEPFSPLGPKPSADPQEPQQPEQPSSPSPRRYQDSRIFAVLRPENAQAKLGFHHMVEISESRPDHVQEPHDVSRVWCVPGTPELEEDVLEYLGSQFTRASSSFSSDDENDQPPRPDMKVLERQATIMSGEWQLRLPPPHEVANWTFGCDRKADRPHIILCRRADRRGLSGLHVLLSFDVEGRITLRPLVSGGPVFINGQRLVPRQDYAILSAACTIDIGHLKYSLLLTEYAETADYEAARRRAVERAHKDLPADSQLAPTPAQAARTVGRWVLGRNLGKGAEGRVFRGDRPYGTPSTAAIKLISQSDPQELSTYQELESLMKEDPTPPPLLRLLDWYPKRLDFEDKFHERYLVLDPLCDTTLGTPSAWAVTGTTEAGTNKCMPSMTALIFQDVLRGLAWLHERGWIHGDIKESNVGLKWCRQTRRPKAFLLDLGGMMRPEGGRQPCTPGRGGTVGWLAPEREREEYDDLVDMWAAGVLGIYLLKGGEHPWRTRHNPHRVPDDRVTARDVKKALSTFERKYNGTMLWLHDGPEQDLRPGEVRINKILAAMVRYSDASDPRQRERRCTAEQALGSHEWTRIVSTVTDTNKRSRV